MVARKGKKGQGHSDMEQIGKKYDRMHWKRERYKSDKGREEREWGMTIWTNERNGKEIWEKGGNVIKIQRNEGKSFVIFIRGQIEMNVGDKWSG
jgi:hypothetical protein